MPALTKKMPGVASDSVVRGEPQRAQWRRNTPSPLAPISSNTAVSPVIVIALLCTKMTVEKALPDCGRQRLQWQRPVARGLSETV